MLNTRTNRRDIGRIFGRGLAFPPRVGSNGQLVWSEGDPNVRESIQIILTTEPGERLRLPEFGAGLGQFLFEPNTTSTRQLIKDRIAKTLGAWEPRAQVETIQVDEDEINPYAALIVITYQLVATQTRERLSLTVQVQG